MFIFRMTSWFRGYITLKITGAKLSELISYLASDEVYLWDVENVTSGFIVVKIYLSEYGEVVKVARKYGCKTSVIERAGLPFLMGKFKRRVAFVLGAAIFVALIYFLSSMIWQINVTGLEKLEEATIVSELEDLGIKKFTPVWRVNTDTIMRELVARLEGVAFVGVTLQGTHLNIEVVEKVLPEKSDKALYLVSAKDAQITKFILLSGTALVKEGDVVEEGQPLVSGTISSTNDMYIQPKAIVEGKVWYSSTVEVPLVIEERQRSGNTKKTYILNVMGKEINVGKLPQYQAYDMEKRVKTWSVGRNKRSIVEIISLTFYELNITKNVLSLEEAVNLAKKLSYEEALGKVSEGTVIVSVNQSFEDITEFGVICRTTIETYEDISATEVENQ